MNRLKVAVGLSGGVDSAVSAWLLKQQGYEVVGVHLYCWPPKEEYLNHEARSMNHEEKERLRKEWVKKNGCRADEDRASALKTALEIEIPFKELDFSEEYNDRVIKYFYKEYEEGRTPNPDVLCNSEIKFGLFLSWALENGFDYIATGHYALLKPGNTLSQTDSSSSPAEDAYLHTRPENSVHDGNQAFQDCVSSFQNIPRLYVPADKHKDQTYFLWKLTEKELKHVLFPLGDLLKSEVREIAKKAGLGVADKKDSQGICFVGNVEVREFLSRRLQKKIGDVVDVSGKIVGKHDGVWFYTIGQRGGWRLDPRTQKNLTKNGELKPLFVLDKNAKENKLVVGEREEGLRNSFAVTELNVRSVEKVKFVRIRHGGELFRAEVRIMNHELWVKTEKEIFGVASGQSAVFYDDDGECLGGGVII